MNITLEQIDEVINRTGATYHQAKEALQFSDGDVVEAIIYLETLKKDKGGSDRPYFNGDEIIGLLKDMIKKGNVTRITLEKNNKIVVDIPILAGLVGSLIFTSATVASILAALVAGCDLKIIKDDGEIIDVKEYTEQKVDRVKEKFGKYNEEPTTEDDFMPEEDMDDEGILILDEEVKDDPLETTEENIEEEK